MELHRRLVSASGDAAALTHTEQLLVSFPPWTEHTRIDPTSALPSPVHHTFPRAAAGHSVSPEDAHPLRTVLKTAGAALPRSPAPADALRRLLLAQRRQDVDLGAFRYRREGTNLRIPSDTASLKL